MQIQLPRLEASVTHAICLQLENLGWVVNESDADNNVTQQRARTVEQKSKLRKANGGRVAFPDFVLYEQGTNNPIGIIEAKRPGVSLESALKQAEDQYARPLGAPLLFAYNDTFVATRYLHNERPLKIDGEDVRQFVDHYTSLRFVNEGPEILSAPETVQISRDELIKIFRRQANLLREAGLQAGLERFGAFSDVLFLKLMDELCQLREHSNQEPPLPEYLRWSAFQDKKPKERLDYVKDVVWKEINEEYGTIFSHEFPIESPEIFDDIVCDVSNLNFTGTDVDVKGDAFEYFLKNAYQGIKIKDLGEYFTPRNIVRTMVSMVDPKIGEKIYDPFCGTGGFLIEAFRYISLRTKITPDLSRILKSETIYGSEISATARVARMNMILFGDGHSNVHKRDSFANPYAGDFDIVLTNPPYSQDTRHGNLYRIPSYNGDAIAVQHCLDALKPNGRAAVLVKEDFLTKGGDIGNVREMLFDSVKNISVVSLPRRLFEPYTPTKTSIIYFEKAGSRTSTFFFVVNNVGHTFGARKKSIVANDLPNVLSGFRNNDEAVQEIDSLILSNDKIKENDYSLWIYDYKEFFPEFSNLEDSACLECLGNHIEKSGERVSPSEHGDTVFRVLGVNNRHGVYLNEEKQGQEIRQKYIRVKRGDLVYNPHRVNVGSVGLVPPELDGGIISGIYIVFRPKQPDRIPASYLKYLLKSPIYLRVIQAYDTKKGAVRGNLDWEQLTRIRISIPSIGKVREFLDKQNEILTLQKQIHAIETDVGNFVSVVESTGQR